MTAALVAFLRERLDEDEQVAQAAAEEGANWSPGNAGAGVWPSDDIENYRRPIVYDEGRPTSEQTHHIARHDPARVLAEVQAKRRIIERCEQYARWAANDDAPGFQALKAAGEHMLRLLALPYSTAPGYRAEWVAGEEVQP